MTIQNELPYGGTGWHGDNAVSLRTTLEGVGTLLDELQTSYAAALDLLDTDLSTSYEADGDIAVAAAAVTAPAGIQHLAFGRAYTHGDNGITLRGFMATVQTQTDALMNALITLAADIDDNTPGAITATDYEAEIAQFTDAATALTTMTAHFAAGGAATHGDQGVAVRRLLETASTRINELQSNFNAFMVKLTGELLPFSYELEVAIADTLTAGQFRLEVDFFDGEGYASTVDIDFDSSEVADVQAALNTVLDAKSLAAGSIAVALDDGTDGLDAADATDPTVYTFAPANDLVGEYVHMRIVDGTTPAEPEVPAFSEGTDRKYVDLMV